MFLRLDTLPSGRTLATSGVALQIFRQYFFDDFQFVAFLAVFVALDTITGLVAAYKNDRLNSRKMWPFVTKVLGYACILFVTHGLTKFPVHGVTNGLFVFFDTLTYAVLMGREALSIFENLAGIDPTLVPAILRRKLEKIMEELPETPDTPTLPPSAPADALEPETPPLNP